jgi:ParB family chromosome partitioning protein
MDMDMARTKATAAEQAPSADAYADQHVWEISLEQIRPAPWNPPARMDPEIVAELADSIAQHGQQIPALLRPVDAELPVRYELVFGHRRFAAARLLRDRWLELKPLRNGQLVASDWSPILKAFIRELSEEEAMVLSGIENLQRQGFSDIEEAEFFKTAGERYGESAVKMLAEKLSVSEKYIRKRVEFLRLPERAQQLWRSGKWHAGHMEQLLRIGEPDQVQSFLDGLDKDRYGRKTEDLHVYELRETINRRAVLLGLGKFDKTECRTCRKNTECQLRLFGGEKEKGKCLDASCFEKKQQGWYDLHWISCAQNKFETRAALVTSTYDNGSAGSFHLYGGKKMPEKCLACDKFTTTIRLNGDVMQERCCFGDSKCFKETEKRMEASTRSTTGGPESKAKDEDAPRVEWHGEYFRQEFYREQVPQLLEGLLTEDVRRLQLSLACFVYQNYELHAWFCEKLGWSVPEKKNSWERHTLKFPEIIDMVFKLSPMKVEYLLAEVAIHAAFFMPHTICTDHDRQAIADWLGVDFRKFKVTEEYLNKKTKGELVRFIVHDSGLWDKPGFHAVKNLRGYTTEEKLANAKKGNLVDLILQCEVDLRGRLPKEIADRPKLETRNADEEVKI